MVAVATAMAMTAGMGRAQNTFTTSANTGTNNDTWTAAANWTGADFPKGSDAAVIQSGLTALANSTAVETFSGGLLIEQNATLQIGSGGNTQNRTESALALGTGPITVKEGALLVWEMKVSPTPPSLTLDGDFTIRQQSTESHSRHFTFANGISGPGQLTFLGVHNGNHVFSAANPDWSGGFVTGVHQNDNTRFNANAAGCFGTGDVTIGFGTDLVIGSAGNAIDDGATLALNGAGRGSSVIKLVMNGSDTVFRLVRDGDKLPDGTYGRIGLGGVDFNVDWIGSGNGILTVSGPPAATVIMVR